jgi:branched-chain amino acid transport system substrate-binding protein
MPVFRKSLAFARVLGGLAVAIALTGCSASPPQNTASIASPPIAMPGHEAPKAAPVKIGLILPMSAPGQPGEIAGALKQGAEMALFDANDPAAQLITKDDGGTPEGATHAADAAIAGGAEIILGPLFAQSVIAAAAVARNAGLPIIAFSNDPGVAGDGVYLMSFLASLEVERIVAFAAGSGKRRFAALIPDSPYGQTVEPAFRGAVAKAGGEIVMLERLGSGASALQASAKRAAAAISDAEKAGNPIDALFLPVGDDVIVQLAPALATAGIGGGKVRLIGTSIWDTPNAARAGVLAGGWYSAPDPAAGARFADKFRKTYGREAPRLATLAYDAMAVALALSKGPKGERFTAANLTRSSGFSGADGPIKLKANGLSERGLAVLEIQKERSVVIDKAPEAATNTNVSAGSILPKFF